MNCLFLHAFLLPCMLLLLLPTASSSLPVLHSFPLFSSLFSGVDLKRRQRRPATRVFPSLCVTLYLPSTLSPFPVKRVAKGDFNLFYPLLLPVSLPLPFLYHFSLHPAAAAAAAVTAAAAAVATPVCAHTSECSWELVRDREREREREDRVRQPRALSLLLLCCCR